MSRRICHSVSKSNLIREFLNLPSGRRVFEYKWEILLFAAAVGFEAKEKAKLVDSSGQRDADSGSAVDFATFDASGCWPGFIDAMSLVEYSDADCLKSDDANTEKRINTFEEYANYGLNLLSEMTVYEMDSVQLANFLLTQIPDEPYKVPEVVYE